MHSFSSCGYFAIYTTQLTIYDLSRHPVKQFSIPRPIQLRFEPAISNSTKIAAATDHAVYVCDLDSDEPITIRMNEPVTDVQWVSPHGEASSGYPNAKQLVVFTALEAHLYSLDCTHILLSVMKPLSGVIERPKHPHWSLLAESVDYNMPSVVYTFHNRGSVSKLVFSANSPYTHVSWSQNGRWLGHFHSSPFGYSLAVTSVLGHSVLSMESDLGATDYLGGWLDNNYAVVGGVTITLISMDNLRVSATCKVVDSSPLGYVRGHYETVARPKGMSGEPRRMHFQDVLVIEYDRSVAIVSKYLVLMREILVSPVFTSVYKGDRGVEVLIVAKRHVLIYEVDSGECTVVLERSIGAISAAYRTGAGTLVVGDSWWELVKKTTEREVTDTFEVWRKRR